MKLLATHCTLPTNHTKSVPMASHLKPAAGGAVPSPFDCFLVNRGLKTLHLRMEAHARNAMACARYLQDSPHTVDVMYPGTRSLLFFLPAACRLPLDTCRLPPAASRFPPAACRLLTPGACLPICSCDFGLFIGSCCAKRRQCKMRGLINTGT